MADLCLPDGWQVFFWSYLSPRGTTTNKTGLWSDASAASTSADKQRVPPVIIR